VKEDLTEPGPTEYTVTIKKDIETKPSYTNQDSSQGHQRDIHLCTPKGENVPWQDVKWERNPYAEACHDSQIFWELHQDTTTSRPAIQRKPSAP